MISIRSYRSFEMQKRLKQEKKTSNPYLASIPWQDPLEPLYCRQLVIIHLRAINMPTNMHSEETIIDLPQETYNLIRELNFYKRKIEILKSQNDAMDGQTSQLQSDIQHRDATIEALLNEYEAQLRTLQCRLEQML
ncbi:hypothetical protein O181_082663 [Austropuccinia psidii MF-1]|uniref:Uncharacterized protein n=1 Tax=Austropuccinia psidii MF-1 TaxID=1389203 RepID=A0A9Q3IIS0_9BASI|nr:hypothetical protein [Austropuccinia psidii MF-1]